MSASRRSAEEFDFSPEPLRALPPVAKFYCVQTERIAEHLFYEDHQVYVCQGCGTLLII